MLDQAHDLRRLATECRPRRPVRRPAGLLAVTGGKGGVGTTTIAMRLATAWPKPGDARCWSMPIPVAATSALLCGVEERHTVGRPLGRPANLGRSDRGGLGRNPIGRRRAWSDDLPTDRRPPID